MRKEGLILMKRTSTDYHLLQKAYQQYMQEELKINDTLPTYYEMCQSEEMVIPIAYTEDEFNGTLVQKQVSYDVINEEEWYQYTTNQHTFTLRIPIDLLEYATYLATARFDEAIIEPDALTMDDIFAYESQATTYRTLCQRQETTNYLAIDRI